MVTGCYTALVTPFDRDAVDEKGLEKLIDFQIQSGIDGILAVGTTGESPTLTWEEHNRVIESVAERTRSRCMCIAGTGSNNTAEALEGTQHAAAAGAQAVLLVDPYYNGPSSLEIRREYVAPVARAFPDLEVIPYVIPGRTGTQLLPEDLGLLYRELKNVGTVKEATGSLENMRRTRACCGPDYSILSGDDAITFDLMTDSQIRGAGVISVVSNIVPGAVLKMVRMIQKGDLNGAAAIRDTLDPLFQLVTVKTMEKTPFGEVVCRARNPLAVKALMSILGMPSGPCRPPLGKMTRNGLSKVLQAAHKVQAETPELFSPIADFFRVNVEERLNTPSCWEGHCYEGY